MLSVYFGLSVAKQTKERFFNGFEKKISNFLRLTSMPLAYYVTMRVTKVAHIGGDAGLN